MKPTTTTTQTARQPRPFVNKSKRLVMLWHKTLECWNIHKLSSTDKVHQCWAPRYSFKPAYSEALIEMEVPKNGFSVVTGFKAPKKLQTWDALIEAVWLHKSDFVNKTPEGRHSTERADCTVRAVALAYDIPYNKAHDLLKNEARRKDRQGARGWLSFAKGHLCKKRINGKTTREVPEKLLAKTVKSFGQHFDKGTFLVSVSQHVTVIKDGVVMDLYNPGLARVRAAWFIS